MIEDYAYVGDEFRGDPNIPFPEGEHSDDRGEKDVTTWCFCFMSYSIFVYFC